MGRRERGEEEKEGEDKQQGCHLAYSYIQGTCADSALLGYPLSLQSCHLAIVPSLFYTVRCLHRIADKPILYTWLVLLVIIFRETERESEIERDKDYQMAPLSDKSCFQPYWPLHLHQFSFLRDFSSFSAMKCAWPSQCQWYSPRE